MDSTAKILLNNDDHYRKSNNEKSISVISQIEEKVIEICDSLLTSPPYDADKTINLLTDYVNGNSFFNRLLYSQISSFVFNLSDEEADTFTHNLLDFFEKAIDKLDENSHILNVIYKFYDHAELALRQKNLLSSNNLVHDQKLLKEELNKIKTDFKSSEMKLSNAENEFNETAKTIKDTQRDYITIFGIFSAIIISFVGGISFSSSVLESISGISIYRLIAIICLLAFVLFNVVYYLISVVLIISSISIDKSIGIKKLRLSIPTFFNMMTIVILIADCLLYYINK